MDLQTKRYLQGAGLAGVGAMGMALSGLNSPNAAGVLKGMGNVAASGLVATAVTASIAGNGDVSGGARLLGLGAGIATGAAVGAATLGGPSRLSFGLGAAAGFLGGALGVMGVNSAE